MNRALVVLWLVLFTIIPAAFAKREVVLKSIKAPHPYYFGEMYLPQLTGGPSSVTWSPDGSEVAYSMAGSLWRQKIDSTEAIQITDGPGYHFQPDWSPDGKGLVYARYDRDAIELRRFDLETGDDSPLTSNGAVNLEPRWSHDGKRIAFVSTEYEGRFHIYTMAIENDAKAKRITDDHDSLLPRYYYSRFDHYLSPTWSADDRDLIFITNRGRIWGTGGLWRMTATPGSEMKELRNEETTWRATPDWARDGKRVVFSSYQGRQWHQLWLMRDDGGDALQLTYGDFDATNARWSPDGKRIAFVTNERGATSLAVVEVPGAQRRSLEIKTRKWLKPRGTLRLTVVDEKGKTIPARVSVTLADGRGIAPYDAWWHAEDSYDRADRPYEASYFHSDGSESISVPEGAVTVVALHGLESEAVKKTFQIAAKSTTHARLVLKKLSRLASSGWISGDMHVHMNYGGIYRAGPDRLLFQARAEDVHVIENLIVNKEGRIPDLSLFTGKPDSRSNRDAVLFHSQEFHTNFWGHAGILGLAKNLLLPGYAGYVNTAAESLYPMNADIADLARAQKALFGYVHPFDTLPNPSDPNETISNELPIDAALGKVDYYEVTGFSDHLVSTKIWESLLNCGFRIPAGGGTDTMANFARPHGPVGLARVYARAKRGNHAAWLEAIRKGETFATNGPLLEFTLEGKRIGSELKLPPNGKKLRYKASLRSIVPVDHLEIVGNGKVVAALTLSADKRSADATGQIESLSSGWYTLRAWSDGPRAPIADLYPFASTSPIYVTVPGAPANATEDAKYFLAWIGRLEEAVEKYATSTGGWARPEEEKSVKARIAEAKAIYRRLTTSGVRAE